MIHESVVHLILLLCFLVAGFIQGFSFPHIVGILGVMAFHYRHDFRKAQEPPASRSVTETQVWQYEELKEKISQLNALIALKTGLRPRAQEPGAQAAGPR